MGEFKREERYIVVKLSDVRNDGDKEAIRSGLQSMNIPTRECVVVEPDWPIYDRTWGMIERLVTNRPQVVDELDAAIDAMHSFINDNLGNEKQLWDSVEHLESFIKSMKATIHGH